MNRTLTSIAAATLVLSSLVPSAFAATATGKGTPGVKYNNRVIQIGSYDAVVQGLVAKDAANYTEFLPLYYVNKGLQALGYNVTWNGNTKVLSITTPSSVTPDLTNISAGQGAMSIQLNGTTVQNAPRYVAKDPANGVTTTYVPLFYLNKVLSRVGLSNSYDGTTWKLTVVKTGAPTVSNFTFSGGTGGTGTSSAPVIANSGQTVSGTAALTDASGNPISGIDLTLTVTTTGNEQPTVSVGGSTVSATQSVTGSTYSYAYSIPTNASGTASFQISYTGNASYTLQLSAPYSVNGSNVTNSSAYVEFGQPGSLLISPLSQTSNFSSSANATAGLVPVTVTVIPAISGGTASNIPVTFAGLIGTSAYYAASNGTYIGTAAQTVYTNAAGQATVYVNANASGASVAANVNASATVNGVVQTSSTAALTWDAAGTATQVANLTGNSQSVNENTKVTLTGTVEDALGNPVPNAQILVSGDDGTNGDFSYVNSAGTTTTFPNVNATATNTSILNNVTASSAFGDLVNANASGNFSVTVVDSTAETPTIQVWAVNNGVIVGPALKTITTDAWTNTSATLNNVYVDTTAQGLASNKNTSISGSFQNGNSGTIYVAGYAGGSAYAPASGTVQYVISGNNNGKIDSVDGVSLNGTGGLPNGPSSAVVNVSYNASNAISAVTVDGVSVTGSTYYAAPSNGAALYFVPDSAKVENDAFTVSSGGYTGTVNAAFSAGTPAEYAVSPSASAVSQGQSTTLTFTVEDSNGNAVPYGSFKLDASALTDTGSGLWITGVNGQTLTTVTGSTYGTQPTPIPLFTLSNVLPSVFVSGAVSATSVGQGNTSQSVTLYADAKGVVTITLAAGGNGYWNTSSNTVQGAPNDASGRTVYFGYNSTSKELQFSSTAVVGGTNETQIGSLSY